MLDEIAATTALHSENVGIRDILEEMAAVTGMGFVAGRHAEFDLIEDLARDPPRVGNAGDGDEPHAGDGRHLFKNVAYADILAMKRGGGCDLVKHRISPSQILADTSGL